MISRLNAILTELSFYHRDKETLRLMYVSDRLEASFKEYDKELKQGLEYLLCKHEKSILKRMKKLDDKPS